MRTYDKIKRVQNAIIEKKMGMYNRSQSEFAVQILGNQIISEHERHPAIVATSPVDLDPASSTFGQLVSIIGFTPIGSFQL